MLLVKFSLPEAAILGQRLGKWQYMYGTTSHQGKYAVSLICSMEISIFAKLCQRTVSLRFPDVFLWAVVWEYLKVLFWTRKADYNNNDAHD